MSAVRQTARGEEAEGDDQDAAGCRDVERRWRRKAGYRYEYDGGEDDGRRRERRLRIWGAVKGAIRWWRGCIDGGHKQGAGKGRGEGGAGEDGGENGVREAIRAYEVKATRETWQGARCGNCA